MKLSRKAVGLVSAAGLVLAGLFCPRASGQNPATVIPIVVDTAVPIVVNTIKPPKPTTLVTFHGTVMHANTAQITVRAQGNDMAVKTFALSPQAAAKMQEIIAKGGYQYGDKVTVMYDPASLQAVKLKGKPSKSL